MLQEAAGLDPVELLSCSDSPSSRWKKHEKSAKNASQQGSEIEGNEDIYISEFENKRNRTKPRRWNVELLGVYTCDAEGCYNKHIQFKTTQLLSEVVHDVAGGRTRTMFFDCLAQGIGPLGTKPGLAY